MSDMRSRMGAANYSEYISAVLAAERRIAEAVATDDPVMARKALRDARYELGRADTRLAAHAAPPA